MRRKHFFHVNCGENRVLRVYLLPLTLADLLLFHRRLDGDMVACREHVAVKMRCESEQTLSVQRLNMRAGSWLHSKCHYIAIATDGHAGA